MRDTRYVMHKDIIVTVQTIEYIGKNASAEEWFEKKINLVSKVIPRNRLSMFQSPLVNCFLKRISLGHWTKLLFVFTVQKQPPRSVPRKRCSENMQQIYRRTPMSKCDLNKIASNFIEIALRHGCSPVNLLHIFRTPFIKNTSGRLLLNFHRDRLFIFFLFWLLGNSVVFIICLQHNVLLFDKNRVCWKFLFHFVKFWFLTSYYTFHIIISTIS